MKHLPARAEGYAWTLIYSTAQHGFSLNTLYRDMKHFDSPVLLIIEDTNCAVSVFPSHFDRESRLIFAFFHSEIRCITITFVKDKRSFLWYRRDIPIHILSDFRMFSMDWRKHFLHQRQ